MSLIVLILIAGGTLLLVALPLVPSLRAWRGEIDSDALVIRDRYEEEAHRTAADVDVRIRRREVDRLPLENLRQIEGDYRLEESDTLTTPISVSGSFVAAPGSTVSAVHAGSDLHLHEGVTAIGWLHAGNRARLDANAHVVGSLSAAHLVELSVGANFERLSARTLKFGRDAEAMTEEAAFLVQEPTPVPENVRWIAWSKAIYDDFEVRGHTWLHGDLIVRGDLRVGVGAMIDGTVKVHGSVFVEDNVRITGGLFCDGDLRIGKECRIDGVCTVAGNLQVDSDTVIGDPDRRVTVNAARMTVADGVRMHGVVLATEIGTVVRGLDAATETTERGTPSARPDEDN